MNANGGLEQASAPTDGGSGDFPARLVASAGDNSNSSTTAQSAMSDVDVNALLGADAFSTDVSDALRFAAEAAAQMGRPREESAEDESGNKRQKVESPQLLHAGGNIGTAPAVLNDGRGSQNSNANLSAGLYNPMTMMGGGNAFANQHPMTALAPAQQQQIGNGNSNNNGAADQLDYNAFLQQSMAAGGGYSPSMMMLMAANNNNSDSNINNISSNSGNLQLHHVQFLNQQRQYAATIAAAAQRGMTVMQQQLQQQKQQQIQQQFQQLQQQQQQKQQQLQQQQQQQELQQHKQQQAQNQAAMMAAMMQQQNFSNNNNSTSNVAGGVSRTSLPVNIHAASLLGQRLQQQHQQQQPPPQSAWHAIPTSAAAALVPDKQVVIAVDEPCLVCKEKGDVFTCNGGCGLHVHVACIGEDALSPSSVGPLCGNCFVMQQNRASKENLQKGGNNGLSVRRAILYLNLETNSQANFDKFGHMASLRLLEIGEIAGYPIKPFAGKFVEPYLQRWIREKLGQAGRTPLNVREIFTFLVGLFSLKQACIAHGLKDKIMALVKARNFSATDFLGWHPSIESPHVQCSSLCQICGIRNPPDLKACARCYRPLSFPSVFTKYASALLATYYAEQVGISLGTSCLDVFSHTNTVRTSYKGLKPYDADGTDWESFTDQLRTIFGMLDIVSNFGVLQLDPDFFEPELKILSNPSYINHSMLSMEYEVVGKFLQSLRLFGPAKTAEYNHLIVVLERFLLVKQMQNGSWCKMNGTTPDQYKATATCAKALATPVFQGYGPTSSEFVRLLEKWAKSTPNSKYPNVPNLKILVSGAKVKPQSRASLKQLEALYRRQMVPESGVNPLERLVTERLRKILPSKNPESVEDESSTTTNSKQSEADSVSGVTDSEDVKKEPKTLDSDAATGATAAKTEGELNSASDNADVKGEVKDEAAQVPDDDDALTSMSLNQDLEIFDGLKFEDGDVIDVNSSRQQLPPTSDEGDDDDNDANEADANDGDGDADVDDTDGAETVRLDEEEEEEEDMEEMYDDDDDENEGDAQQQEGAEELQDDEPEEVSAAEGDGIILGSESLDDQISFADSSSIDFSLDT